MSVDMAPLSASILALNYFGDVVFAISGALVAAKYRMDIIGFVLIGTITGIGGGTMRDLLLGRPVWWVQDPTELLLCAAVALATFFFIKHDISNRKGMIWSDALGLAAFSVVGCHVALEFGAHPAVAVFMGMVTATGGGVIRDLLTKTEPMILCGQPYATVALLGALTFTGLFYLGAPEWLAEGLAFITAFAIRAVAILLDIRMGPPGEFLRIGKR